MLLDSFHKAPPYGLVHNWLGARFVQRLLDYATSTQHQFEDSPIGYGGTKVDTTHRRSVRQGNLGDLRTDIEKNILSALPGMYEKLGCGKFEPHKLELEMVAHGNGAFFARHVDTFKQRNAKSHRIISAVYYFHAAPKAFTGGVLRLHSLAPSSAKGSFVDIEPNNDTLVFFPAWFPHEVTSVKCLSGRFKDSRFAINCWVHRE